MNSKVNRQVQFIDLGTMNYQKAWDFQTSLHNQTLAVKAENRGLPDSAQKITLNHLLFCEHPHVFTLGKSGEEKNLLIKQEDLHKIGATYYHINRGGDITYHGPGQLVVYPVLDLETFY